MKRPNPKPILALLLISSFLILTVITASTQGGGESQRWSGEARISRHPATGAYSFLGFSPDGFPGIPGGGAPAAEASRFLRVFASEFGVQNPEDELLLVATLNDAIGMTHMVYHQFYQGIRVFGGQLRIHLNRGNQVVAANGSLVPHIQARSEPTISRYEAESLAVNLVTKGKGLDLAEDRLQSVGTQLLIFHDGLLTGLPDVARLAFEVEVVNDSGSISEFVYLDAHSGRKIEQVSGIKEELNRRLYQSTIANLVWAEGDNFPTYHTDWNNELDGTAEAYNFFASMSGWDSYDDNGAIMEILNDPDEWNCAGYPNATWDGHKTNFCPSTTADDVVAHEWAHAFTDHTNGLIYKWQSGALNEAFSDIWGETIDQINQRMVDAPSSPRTDGGCSIHRNRGTDNSILWLMGEDASAFGGAIRDMWNPSCYDDPGKTTDTSYHCSESDSGGVHTNSAIPNHLYALLVDGGNYNGVTVPAIGMTRAAHIHWRAQNYYLGPTSNFADHADALEQSCQDLIGYDLPELKTNSSVPGNSGQTISSETCSAVADAISAVSLRNSPDCGFSTLLEPNAPPICSDDEFVHSVASEDWEEGSLPGDWTAGTRAVANPLVFETDDWAIVSNLPSGAKSTYAAFVADALLNLPDCTVEDDQSGVLYLQSPAIVHPAESENIRLAFDHWIATEKSWDGANVKISVNDGNWQLLPASAFSFNPYNGMLYLTTNTNPLQGEQAFTGTDQGSTGGSWGQSQVNLAGLSSPGDSLRVRFELGIDSCNGQAGWYLDEVQAYYCSPTPPEGYTCGNALLNSGETCDDGDYLNNDGCSKSCQIETGWACTEPVPFLADGSFENGREFSSWSAESTNFPTPICSVYECPGGTPSEGDYFTRFGGKDGYELSTIEQTIPISTTIEELSFDLWVQQCDSQEDYLQVTIDNNIVFSTDPCTTSPEYETISIDASTYADGNAHTLRFMSESQGVNGTASYFYVDNIRFSDAEGKLGLASFCSTNRYFLPFTPKQDP